MVGSFFRLLCAVQRPVCFTLALWLGVGMAVPAWGGGPSYNFEVRPILADKCFACHGMDAAKRKGKLRLDVRDAALETKAVVPGDVENSTLWQRITSADEDDVMPPPDKHHPVSPEEREVLRAWIQAGAVYEGHWAYTPPVRPVLPLEVSIPSAAIDALVARRLADKGLLPAPPAERTDWLRRVSFAITGLPPTPQEVAGYLTDTSAEADAKVVDRLLQSPHCGERLAAAWLDAARYADTYGRHEDADSPVWRYRDWVISAFNANLPYDEFLTAQMAGDLMPNATQEQRVATAFHRLASMSNESGSDPEEFRWDMVFDRVKTTSTAVLGLTMECARCHDHKYDPFSQRDYYGMAAFFDKIDEFGLFFRYVNTVPPPNMFFYESGERASHESLKKKVAEAEARLSTVAKTGGERFKGWLESHQPPLPDGGLWAELQQSAPRMSGAFPQPAAYLSFDLYDMVGRDYLLDSQRKAACEGNMSNKDVEGKLGRGVTFRTEQARKIGLPQEVGDFSRWQPFSFSLWLKLEKPLKKGVILHHGRGGLDSGYRGYDLTFEDGRLTATLAYSHPGNSIRLQSDEDIDFTSFRHIGYTYDGSSRAEGVALYVDGKRLKTTVVRDHLTNDIRYRLEWGDYDNRQVADADLGKPIRLTLGGRTLDAGLKDAVMDELRVYDEELSAVEIARLGSSTAASGDESAWLAWYLREEDEDYKTALAEVKAARKAESDFAVNLDVIMVMDESHGPRRQTFMLNRGDWTQPKDAIEAATPAALNPFPEGAPRNRLGLAQWLTDPKNPLTSRVQVNRLWTQFFGRGLVTTAEDFGLQGRVPVHVELLDYLAVHFRESGWDIKALCRAIALSKTYRQGSRAASAETHEMDPENQWLARGPRFRLTAEQLRDAALYSSELLKPQIGGPSVRPWQPEGLWEDSGTQHVYVMDKGDALHRRSLYTFWRRTCPPPVMSLLDAPTREFCMARRPSTQTPLQALALMNDMGFLEAARSLAEKLVKSNPGVTADADHARVQSAFMHLVGREPTQSQLTSLTGLLAESRAHYSQAEDEAVSLLASTGFTPSATGLPSVEVASTLLITRALINSEPFCISY
jgi:hypothetical protein